MLLSLVWPLTFAAPVVTVAAAPSPMTSPLTAENLAIFATEVERCVAEAGKGTGGAWYGTAKGTWTPSVQTVEFESIVPRPDFDAWPAIGNCIGTGKQQYPYPGMGAFSIKLAPAQSRPVVVAGTAPELAEEVRLVTLACIEGAPTANGRFVLSRHGSTKLADVFADVLYQPNDALAAVAFCVASRVGPRTDAPVSTQGVIVTLGVAGPAGSVATTTVANGKAFKPKSLLVRNSVVDPDYLILEIREKKTSCDSAVSSKDLALFVHAPKTADTVHIGRDPYIAAWWGDRQHGREPVYASNATIVANPNPGAGTASATLDVAGPDPSQYGLTNTTLDGVYCFN